MHQFEKLFISGILIKTLHDHQHTAKKTSKTAPYLRHPGEAPLNALLLFNKFLFRWRQISACICSGKLFNT